MVSMYDVDLNRLAVISEIHSTRSVSKTADHLGLLQSAVSMSLARRRRHFNDPICIRTSGGLQPTPHASK